MASGSSLGEVAREQTKLMANYFNGIAIGLVLVGGLSVPTTIFINSSDVLGIGGAIVLGLFSFGMSVYLHARAKRVLKGLEP